MKSDPSDQYLVNHLPLKKIKVRLFLYKICACAFIIALSYGKHLKCDSFSCLGFFKQSFLKPVFFGGVSEHRLLQHNLRNRCVVPNHAPNMGLKTPQ